MDGKVIAHGESTVRADHRPAESEPPHILMTYLCNMRRLILLDPREWAARKMESETRTR